MASDAGFGGQSYGVPRAEAEATAARLLAAVGLAQHVGMTMIVVTHEIRFAAEVADRVIFMDEGRVVEQGPPKIVIGAPRHERTRRFLRLVSQADVQNEVSA